MTKKYFLPDVSFEFFPPQELQIVTKAAEKLMRYKPSFCSVTYGAGGSTQDRTLNTVNTLKEQLAISIAPHLSCVGASKFKIQELLDYFQEHAIDRIVVLRGDMPSGLGNRVGDFRYAAELVSFIRKQTGDYFHLEVAVYPESHPEAECLQNDLRYFKEKISAGANSAITQYFYNADAYYHLLEQCGQLSIEVPIVPGIMPITNYEQLARFSQTCGAEIPRWIRKKLEGYKDDLVSIRAFGVEVVARLCETLLSYGAPGLHFYTLNRAEPTLIILDHLTKGHSAIHAEQLATI